MGASENYVVSGFSFVEEGEGIVSVLAAIVSAFVYLF